MIYYGYGNFPAIGKSGSQIKNRLTNPPQNSMISTWRRESYALVRSKNNLPTHSSYTVRLKC